MADEDKLKDKSSEGDADQFEDIFNEGEIDISLFSTDDDKGGDDDNDKGGKKDTQEIDEEKRLLKEENDRLKADKTNLNKALHEERQSRKKVKDADGNEVVLTDADLAKIIEEHKNDPAVLLNAVSYKVQQLTKKAKTEAIDEVEVKQKADQFNSLLRQRYGDALDDDGSVVRQSINKAKTYLGLDDNPYGDALSAAAVVFAQLPQTLQSLYEKGQQDALDGKVEKNRLKNISEGKTLLGGKKDDEKKKTTGLTEDQMEVAKKFGWKPGSPQMKIYMSQIKKQAAA